MEEVHKLLIVGLIRKIYYPEWLAKHYRGQKKKKKKIWWNMEDVHEFQKPEPCKSQG